MKFWISALVFIPFLCEAQIDPAIVDSTYIDHYENRKTPDKVLHAEPLYIDLIRDLGARKGERELNIGMGLTDKVTYDSYEALIEYEWAPIDRLGFEVELPFTFHTPTRLTPSDAIPKNRLNSLKVATQWSFFVSEKWATSMALGYIHEFELAPFDSYQKNVYRGNVFNPFFVVAKRWGNNFHSLIYTGPMISREFDSEEWHSAYEMHTSFHYMIPTTRNFIGIEFNKEFADSGFNMTIRPQMRLAISEHTMVGIVAGIPVHREGENFGTFLRLIWEP